MRTTFRLTVLFLATLALLVGPIPQEAQAAPVSGFPDYNPTSGRFTTIVRGTDSVGDQTRTHVQILVPGSLSTFELGIFDGDVNGGTWDPLRSGVTFDENTFTLYADPNGTAATSTQISGASWSSSTDMVDDGWFTQTITNASSAETSSGDYLYNLEVTWDSTDIENESNNFKVRAEGKVFGLANFMYSFIGFGQNDPNSTLYPATSYNGEWQFSVDVPSSLSVLNFWDGDADRDGDTDDGNSPADFDPNTGGDQDPPGETEGARDGNDQSIGSPLTHAPSIYYQVIGPNGVWTVTNNDPSGNLEWELYRLRTVTDGTEDTLVSSLPAGSYTMYWHGVDGRNTVFFLSNYDFQIVPEPATWALFGVGLLALTYARRRRKTRA